MTDGERQKKNSVTQLVHSTIGLSLLKPAEPSVAGKSIANPEDDNMAARLTFYSKASAGSASSEKAAGCEDSTYSEVMTSLDSGSRRPHRRHLPHQPSQDG